jgi:hypothetical protein
MPGLDPAPARPGIVGTMYGIYKFLLDEDVPETIWNAIQQHNVRGNYPIDVFRVGDPPAPPKRSSDPNNLIWAESADRILVTRDKQTLPGHFADHLAAGHSSAGVVVLLRTDVTSVVNHLVEIAHCGLPGDWLDRFEYFP